MNHHIFHIITMYLSYLQNNNKALLSFLYLDSAKILLLVTHQTQKNIHQTIFISYEFHDYFT
jgi:hypothetical protein